MPLPGMPLSSESQEMVARLTQYATTCQLAMDHSFNWVCKSLARLEPYYDEAMEEWKTHPLREIPNIAYTEARGRWFEDLHILLEREPPAHDIKAWVIRSFACSGVVQAILEQEMDDMMDDEGMPNEEYGSIIGAWHRATYKSLTGLDPEEPGPPLPREPELIGETVDLMDLADSDSGPHTRTTVRCTIVDHGQSALFGEYYLVEYETLEGKQTEKVPADEVESCWKDARANETPSSRL